MILIDTSAWIEFLRDTGSVVCERVDRALDGDIATCDPVRMELLAGARNEVHLGQLRALIARAVVVSTGPGDFDGAATLYRVCRSRGETVRTMIDCLIAAVAIREDVPVLHADSDFEALARHTELKIAT